MTKTLSSSTIDTGISGMDASASSQNDRLLQSPEEQYDQLAEPVYSAFVSIARKLSQGQSVLDVGCGNGKIGEYLSRHSGAMIDGVEPADNRRMIAQKRLHYVSAVPAGQDDPRLQARYDVITFFDVLEHFVAPEQILMWAITKLKPSGTIYALIPNSAHWKFRWKVLRGDWRLEDYGLFDRTHLRFFDIRTAEQLAPAYTVSTLREFHAPPPTPRVLVRRLPNLFALHCLFGWTKA